MIKLLAVYETKEQLIEASKHFDTTAEIYTGFDLEALTNNEEQEPLDFAVPGFLGAVVGGASGYFMQYYLSVIDLPLNEGGRPIHTAVAFIPITFECTVFGAALAIITAFFFSTKLPLLYHPLFGSPKFLMSRENPFFIVVDESEAEKLAQTRPQKIERIES